MKKRTTTCAGLAASSLAFLLEGCAYFTPPLEHPVAQNQVLNVGTISMVASRRAVYVVGRKVELDVDDRTITIDSQFCAEPPPDVTENIVSSFTGKLEGSANAETKEEVAKLEAQAKADLAKALTTQGSPLSKRTQGAQYLRDSLYNLCQGYLNGALSPAEYKSQLSIVFMKAAELIATELPLMYEAQKTVPTKSATATPPGN